ncbi:ABC transporter substrate-binding protein [Klenkia terrae]|uniref:ABC transporter substrate-binding protein n=1 Tax=Klenkia terrae TaxID=1052259 RepID=UPI003611146F
MEDLEAENIVAAPAGWTSLYLFQDAIVESGPTYCAEAMNGVDYAVETNNAESVMAVHYAGDYGGDAAAGASIAAEANGIDFANVETTAGTDNQASAVAAIVEQQPDVVVVSTGPADMATIVGQSVAAGYTGKFLGSSPTWNVALLQSPAAPALQASYQLLGPWAPFDSDTPGHEAMRAAAEESGSTPNEFFLAGWAWSYPLKAALEAAAENGDLTREGLYSAASGLSSVDYEGILPEGSGDYADGGDSAAVRVTQLSSPDPEASTGISVTEEDLAGSTAEGYEFTEPCYEAIDL